MNVQIQSFPSLIIYSLTGTGVKKISSTQPESRLGSDNFFCHVLYIDFDFKKSYFETGHGLMFWGKNLHGLIFWKKFFIDWGDIDFFPKFRLRSMCTWIGHRLQVVIFVKKGQIFMFFHA